MRHSARLRSGSGPRGVPTRDSVHLGPSVGARCTFAPMVMRNVRVAIVRTARCTFSAGRAEHFHQTHVGALLPGMAPTNSWNRLHSPDPLRAG